MINTLSRFPKHPVVAIIALLTLNCSHVIARNRGIFNENGNDCFMNASTQALSHMTDFIAFSDMSGALGKINSSKQLKTFYDYINELRRLTPADIAQYDKRILEIDADKGLLAKTAQEMKSEAFKTITLSGSKLFREYFTNSANFGQITSSTLAGLKGTVQITLPGLRNGQRDAQEFISAILDVLDFYFDGIDKVHNPIKSIKFKFRTSTISSQCSHKSLRDDPSSLLSLEIPENNKGDLMSCFTKYSEDEDLKDDARWRCTECTEHSGNFTEITRLSAEIEDLNTKKPQEYLVNKKSLEAQKEALITYVNAKKHIKISALSRILIINLKRFRFGDLDDKISTPVTFPIQFDLDKNSPILDEEITKQIGNSKISYSLFAFVCHGGGTGGGHYWAYGKSTHKYDLGNWFNYNDSHVSAISSIELTNILNQNSETGAPYILFYELAPASQLVLQVAGLLDTGLAEPQPQDTKLQQQLKALQTRLGELKSKLHILQGKLVDLKKKLKV